MTHESNPRNNPRLINALAGLQTRPALGCTGCTTANASTKSAASHRNFYHPGRIISTGGLAILPTRASSLATPVTTPLPHGY